MSINTPSHPMRLAIQSAIEGVKEKEGGPFGACVVKDNKVIAVAHNTVLRDGDPTCHAEMNAIRLASKKLGTYELKDCEIYSTAEPCPMCLAAIYWARIDKIYVSVDKSIAAKYGFDDDFFYQQMAKSQDKRHIPCEMGVLSEESEAVFKTWQALGGLVY